MSEETKADEMKAPDTKELKASFVKTPIVALMDPRLSGDELRVYMIMTHMNRCFGEGKLYPGQDYLEEVTRMTRSTIQRHLRKLRALGLITAKKQKYGGNNVYDIVPPEKAYSPEALEATRKLPAKGESPRLGRTRSRKSLEKWWSSLDPALQHVGSNLCTIRDKHFNYDAREVRKLQQVLHTATAWFNHAGIQSGWSNPPLADMKWVAERPIDIVTKPNTRLTIDDKERSILALAPGIELLRAGTVHRFEDTGLVVVRGIDDIWLLPIQTPIDRLASI